MSGPRYATASRGSFGQASSRETRVEPMEMRKLVADKKARARAAFVCDIIACASTPRESTNFVAFSLGLADHDTVADVASEAHIAIFLTPDSLRLNEREAWAAAAMWIREGGV